jgi:hypothetical protein
MTMIEQTDTLHNPELTWAVILEAAREQQPSELAEIAFSLYGQLGEARAEICRLRASLHTCMRGRSGQRPAHRPPSANLSSANDLSWAS